MVLTAELSERIDAVVGSGAYASPEEALDAAVAAIEAASVPDFEGTEEELAALLRAGEESGAGTEMDDAFWAALDRDLDALATAHSARTVGR